MSTIHVDVVSAEESIFRAKLRWCRCLVKWVSWHSASPHSLITRIKPGAVRIQRADNNEEEFVSWLAAFWKCNHTV